MLTVRLLSAVRKPATGTPGSSAVQRGFDVRAETGPGLYAYRVAVVWTQNGWLTVNHTECRLAEVRGHGDVWTAGISFLTTGEITFYYALAAAGPDGRSWDNNQGWNYVI